MKKLVWILIVAFVVLTSVNITNAQVPNSVPVTETPASREDVVRATENMKRAVMRAIDRAERKSAEQLATERENARKQAEALQAEQKKRDLEVSKAQEEARIKTELLISEQKSAKKMVIATVVVVGGILLTLGFIFRSKTKSEYPQTVEQAFPRNSIVRFTIDKDTVPAQLRRHVESHPSLFEVLKSQGEVAIPCILELPYREGSEVNGAKLNCVVTLKEDMSAIVRFDDAPERYASWKNRNLKAAEVAKMKKAA
jgi:hypothetical protein